MFVYKHFAYYYLLVQWSNDKFPFPNMDGQNCHLRCLLFSILTNNRISKFQDWCKWVHLVNAIFRQLTDLSPRESISWWSTVCSLNSVMLMCYSFFFSFFVSAILVWWRRPPGLIDQDRNSWGYCICPFSMITSSSEDIRMNSRGF